MGPQDAILGNKVLILQEQFLIDQTGYEREEPRPLVILLHAYSSIMPESRTDLFTIRDANGDFNAENGSESNPNQYYFSPRLA